MKVNPVAAPVKEGETETETSSADNADIGKEG